MPDQARLTRALADRYRIEREIGSGGMATVYLAHDIKHERKVAVKVLRPELAAVLGAERFVVEIKTTAGLSHPHILPLFDSGTVDGFLFYVMPFIEGETLREKLNRETQLGIEEALRITTEVADALDYAHRHGLIHRDIKPENILLHDGRAMVADFGIALAVSAAAGGRMTETGLSLGTPHYMSPEQATAEKKISGRSDVYSLASVLYEMLTGEPPHTGSSAQQIIMKIIADTPRPVRELRRSVPAHVGAAVAQALEKLPADRFATAKAFAEALADRGFQAEGAATTPGASRTFRGWIGDPRSWVALALVGVLGVVAAVATWRSSDNGAWGSASRGTMRLTIAGPPDSSFVSMAWRGWEALSAPVVSPDDRHVAFTAATSAGTTLYLRPLDSFELITVAEGEIPGPFFSPDGSALGFIEGANVWTTDVAERAPVRVAAIPESWFDITSAAWHPDGRILVSVFHSLWAVPAKGGDPEILVVGDSTKQERIEQVEVLPDGRILLNIFAPGGGRVEVVAPDGSGRTTILPGASRAWLVEDILLYSQSGQYRATRFDLRKLEPMGATVGVQDPATRRLGRSIAWADATGTLNLELVWRSPSGGLEPVGVPTVYYRWPRLSPDGRRMAIGVQPADSSRLSVFHIASATWSSLDGSTEPVWSPDGRWVYQSIADRPSGGLIVQVADGSRAPDTLLYLRAGQAWPTSVSPDGDWLAYYGSPQEDESVGVARDPSDLSFMDLRTRETRRLSLPGFQRGARFSPDGGWVAYQTSESGQNEVHLRPWPALDARFMVSRGGGEEPAWSPDGRTLYYRRGDQMMAVSLTLRSGGIEPSPPRVHFAGTFLRDPSGDQDYDIAPDGRFLLLRPIPGGRASVQVAINWIAEIRARLDRAQEAQ
jgi:eukaryotic-like serine/threonine-protein kinase